MKIRTSFVSNSSSSSFIVIGVKPPKVNSVQLDPVTARNVINFRNSREEEYRKMGYGYEAELVEWDGKKSVFLTQLLSDAGTFTDPFEGLEYHSYGDGEHGQVPYGWHCDEPKDRYFVCIDGDDDGYDAIFVRKDDMPKKAKKKPAKKSVKKVVKKKPAKKTVKRKP
jgi:hypothetical protein